MDNQIIVLGQWEKAKQAITECRSINELKQIRDKSEALRAYAKQAKEGLEVQNNIADIKLRCERRIGEFSKELPKENANQYKSASSHDGKLHILKEAGIRHFERYESIANLPEKEFEEYINQNKKNNKELTTSGIIRLSKEVERKQDIKEQKQDIESGKLILPEGTFEVIVIDPAWSYGTKYSSTGRRVSNPYPEMTGEELQNLDIPASENSILFLWTTHKFIFFAKSLLDFWGFQYRNIIVWDKEQLGIGDLQN